MIGRLLCWLGFHDWTPKVRAPGTYRAGYRARVCVRCLEMKQESLR